MKKIVLTFGLISGAISAALMMSTVSFVDRIGFDRGVYVGYTAIVMGLLLVFFGIRSYRENVGDGYISFGRAFQVGILIALISSLIYILTWEVVFHNWLYDFPEKFTSYAIEKARASGASAEELARQSEEWKSTWALYRSNFLVRAAYTFIEHFPVGLIVTVISAVILRKRPKEVPAQVV